MPCWVQPEPADRIQCRVRPGRCSRRRRQAQSVELADERRHKRMRDLLQEFSDRVVRRHLGPQHYRAERRFVALRRTANEIIAKHVRHPAAVDPPILGMGQRRPHRNARHGIGEKIQREIHCPRRIIPALRQYALDRLAAIGTLAQRRNRRARQRPAVAFDILQHHGERDARQREQPHGLDELLLRIKRTRMRGIGAERAEDFIQLVETRRKQRRLDRAGRDAGRFQFLPDPPGAQLLAEDDAEDDERKDEVNRNNRVIHATNLGAQLNAIVHRRRTRLGDGSASADPACSTAIRLYPCEMNLVTR